MFGFGYGLGWSLSSVGTQTVVPTEKAGAASGVTLAIVIGAGGLCVALAATLIQSITAGGTGSERRSRMFSASSPCGRPRAGSDSES